MSYNSTHTWSHWGFEIRQITMKFLFSQIPDNKRRLFRLLISLTRHFIAGTSAVQRRNNSIYKQNIPQFKKYYRLPFEYKHTHELYFQIYFYCMRLVSDVSRMNNETLNEKALQHKHDWTGIFELHSSQPNQQIWCHLVHWKLSKNNVMLVYLGQGSRKNLVSFYWTATFFKLTVPT